MPFSFFYFRHSRCNTFRQSLAIFVAESSLMKSIRNFLGRQVDNSNLIVFRIGFGFLLLAECWGAILTGWVRRVFIEPDFTFSYIGFEWLQPLDGQGMYYYFFVMGLLGLFIMLGFAYRISSVLFCLLWLGSYLMQKTSYNNHYYLLIVLSGLMAFIPAHKGYSLDVKWGRTERSDVCHYGYIFLFIVQVGVVYVFASINKIYPDWLHARPIEIWFGMKRNYFLIGPLLTQRWFQYVIAYGGIIYDGVIVFLLLNRRTRKLGFFLSIFFNLFNSVVFQIGIFPYMMILFSVIFYPGETIRKTFLRGKTPGVQSPGSFPKWATYAFLAFVIIQILLPLRHWVIPGNVNWTEEGHKMSWRMMLRSKNGTGRFLVVDQQSGKEEWVDPRDYLTFKQFTKVASFPDMTWQFAQRLEKIYLDKGWKDVAVYAHVQMSLNGGPRMTFIDPTVNLAATQWNFIGHADWKLTPEYDRSEK